MIHVSSGLSRAGRAEHTGNAYRQRQWIYATSPFGTSPGGPMSTSTLSRPQARRTTVLVVVGPAPGVPDWAARWAGRSGWALQRRGGGGAGGGGAGGGPGAPAPAPHRTPHTAVPHTLPLHSRPSPGVPPPPRPGPAGFAHLAPDLAVKPD